MCHNNAYSDATINVFHNRLEMWHRRTIGEKAEKEPRHQMSIRFIYSAKYKDYSSCQFSIMYVHAAITEHLLILTSESSSLFIPVDARNTFNIRIRSLKFGWLENT